MSVVACKVTKDGFEIASDSITMRGYTQSRGQNVKHSKLFELNNMMIGGVGLAEETSLLYLFAATRHPGSATQQGILEFMSDFSDWKNKKINKSSLDNRYLIGFDGSVFLCDGWFVSEVVTYHAIGAGSDFALAALHLGHSAEKAVETAIELSIACEGPVNVLTHSVEKKKK